MSYVTSKGICCAYPTWTFQHVGVLSPRILSADDEPYSFVKRLMRKSEARGFTFRATPIVGRRECDHTTSTCVDLRRGFEDPFCYTLYFDTADAAYHVGGKIVVSDINKVGWQFGGHHFPSRCVDSYSRVFNAVTGTLESKITYGRLD